MTSFLKILGTYPIEDRGRTEPTIETIAGGKRSKTDGRVTGDGSRVSGESEVASESGKAGSQHRGDELARRGTSSRDSVIRVRGVAIGGPEFVVIAGPSAVESAEQIRACARHVRECGGKVLSGGCFKPHASLDGFQGLGFDGLDLLVQAGREYDLPVVAEVFEAGDVEKVAELADILLVGSHNMQNYSLLGELGGVNRPVMLQRGMSASLDEFLGAAEHILVRGNQQVVLCERGIRTFETSQRNTLDLGSIPILKTLTHLPVIVDPSHAAGRSELVTPLALASHAVGPNGIRVEIHPNPDEALCDGGQALTFDEFHGLTSRVFR